MRLRFDLPLLSLWLLGACAELEGEPADPPVLAQVARPGTSAPVRSGLGEAATASAIGIDSRSPFHQALGVNGRSCATCHLPLAGWSVTPAQIEELFVATQGIHPLFMPFDANYAEADVSTVQARRQAYAMLRKGLFRRGGVLPAEREFDVVDVQMPADLGPPPTTDRLTVFRRPLATANLGLAKNIGWDDNNTRDGQDVLSAQAAQAEFLIRTNLMAGTPSKELVDEVVAYQSAIWFAQVRLPSAGELDACGARGGPVHLAQQKLVPARFDLFDAWIPGRATADCASPGRAAIARGQELFNTKLNSLSYTCRDCHSVQNAGSNAAGATFNIGVSHERWASVDGLPIYTLRQRVSGVEVRTTDPGKAFRTGRWLDLNHFKVPSLRGLGARAPYFHNGFAKTLGEVVRFYEVSLGFSFSAEEEADLVAFLDAL